MIFKVIEAIIYLVASIIIVSEYSILFFLMISFLSICSGIISLRLRKKKLDFDIANTELNRKVSYYDNLFKNKVILTDARVSNYTDFLKEKYFALIDERKEKEEKHYKKTMFLRILNMLVNLVLKLSAYISIVLMVALKSYGVGIYYYLISIVLMMSANIKSIINLYNNQMTSNVSTSFYNKIFKGLTLDKENNRQYEFLGKAKIEFKHVSFTYPNTDIPVLKDVSFEVNPQQSLGIVGENGAGKTTILKLLLGVYDNYEGEILIDGIDIKTLEKEVLARYFSVIFQDFNHYALSFYENIYLGDLDKEIDVSLMDTLIKESELDARVEKSYAKGNSELTKILSKDSEELSIGQWQKLALIRAIYREYSIIILDEPVASLDATAEKVVFDIINNLERTRLVISHRLADMIRMDKIIVIIDGQVVACGSHKDLMMQNSYYHEMFELQARKYK